MCALPFQALLNLICVKLASYSALTKIHSTCYTVACPADPDLALCAATRTPIDLSLWPTARTFRTYDRPPTSSPHFPLLLSARSRLPAHRHSPISHARILYTIPYLFTLNQDMDSLNCRLLFIFNFLSPHIGPAPVARRMCTDADPLPLNATQCKSGSHSQLLPHHYLKT